MDDKVCIKVLQYKQSNNNDILESILLQMMPLIKKYARKSYFFEYDDAFQEYSIAVIEAVKKIRYYENEQQCLSYIQECVRNKFYQLYRFYKNEPDTTDEYTESNLPDNNYNPYNDRNMYLDLWKYISSMDNCSETKQKIAVLSLIYGESDTEISHNLHITRQYVNRIKRAIYKELRDYLQF